MALLTLTSYSDKYSEPVWYEMNFNDGVIHLWHRSVLYNTELFETVQDSLDLKYKGKSEIEIEIESAETSLKINRVKRKEYTNKILESIEYE